MNWFQTQLVFVDAAGTMVEFAVNWLLQSTLLLTIGLIVGRLLTRRGAAVQSAVYRTTLVAVLVCPFASWCLSLAGVSGWSLAMPRPWTVEQPETIVADAAPPVAAPSVASEVAVDDAISVAQLAETNDDQPQPHFLPGTTGEIFAAPQFIDPADNPVEAAAPSAPTIPDPPTTQAPAAYAIHVWGFAALGIVAVWWVACAVCLVRLGTAWWWLFRLRRDALPADAPTRQACHTLATRLGVATPEVLRSPYLPSPCLAGLRRPAVLLPEIELSLSIRDVLVHELAHLARRDCHWNLLRQLALSAFFFQPLLWMLSRRLEATAEEVCDDYVVHHGGDRAEYALRLIDIAELSTAPVAAAGVGIVSLRSMLAWRVQRIMDTSRSLSTRAGSFLLTWVLVGGLAGTTIVGLVGIGPQRQRAEAADVEGNDVDGNDEATADLAAQEDTGGALDNDLIIVRGRVLDAEGKPTDAATVRLVRWHRNTDNSERLNETKCDPSGNFEVTYRKSQFEVDPPDEQSDTWRKVAVVAFRPGAGPDWVWLHELPSGQQVELRLPIDDVAITGRVVDLEGRPLAGIRVECGDLESPKGDDLSAWLEAVKQGEPPWTSHVHVRGWGLAPAAVSLPNELLTDADGRFRIAGLGRERKIRLEFKGPAIARTSVDAVTRKMPPIEQTLSTIGRETRHVLGADFVLTLPPSRAIEGIIRDAENGQPLEGVSVQSWRFAGSTNVGRREILTESDDQGRFRLVGMPKGEGNEIVAVPNDEQPYFMRVVQVPDEPGLEPVEINFALHRGIWIAGCVTDQVTNQPIPGARLCYLPFLSNEYAQALPEFDSNGNVDGTSAYQDRYLTGDDGTYRLVGLPGRAIVGVVAVRGPYYDGAGAADIQGMDANGHFPTFYNPIAPSKKWPTAMREIEPAEDAETVELNFALDPGKQIEMTTVDPAGRPIAGVLVRGMTPNNYQPPTDSPTFVASGFGPDEERTMLLHHEKQRLGKVVRARAADAANQLTVQLEPCATITGRLVDENQAAITGAQIRIDVLPSGDFSKHLNQVTTDAEGRFTHSAVLPGADYAVNAQSAEIGFETVAKKVPIEPGETIDLGTIDITSDERPEPVRTKAAQPAAESVDATAADGKAELPAGNETTQSVEFTGTVLEPNGQPASGARVYLLQDVPTVSEPILMVRTKPDGTFAFTVTKKQFNTQESSEPWLTAKLVAIADGHGLAWALAASFEPSGQLLDNLPLHPNSSDRRDEVAADKVLRLVADGVPIEGRILDIEGRGVAGARVRVIEIRRAAGANLDAWLEVIQDKTRAFDEAWDVVSTGFNSRRQVEQLFPDVTTGADGRFRLRGVGRERIALLQMEGAGIETRQVWTRTRSGPTIHVVDPRFPQDQADTYHGAVFSEVVGPSWPVKGVVRDKETGRPLAGARVEAYRLAGVGVQPYPNTLFYTVTDSEGRYKLLGLPAGTNELLAQGPRSEPYLVSALPAEVNGNSKAIVVDFHLKRGVWIRGRVTDAASGAPVRGMVYYYAFLQNPHLREAPGYSDAFALWFGTDMDGRFEIAGLPGRGIVGVRANNYSDYPIGVGADRIEGRDDDADYVVFRTAPQRCMACNFHAVAAVNPEENGENGQCDFALVPGPSVSGTVLDPQGAPLDGTLFVGAVEAQVWQPLASTSFKVRNLQPGQSRRVQFYHAERRLAGTALVRGNEQGPLTVTLEPWATITGRVVDAQGEVVGAVRIFSRGADDSRYGVLPKQHAFQTDGEGRFKIEGLAPGVPYVLAATKASRLLGTLTNDLKLAAGDTKDLGDLLVVSDESREKSSGSKTVAEKPVVEITPTVFGRVTLAGGEPAERVHVAVIAMRPRPTRGGEFTSLGDVLAEGRTDADGNYRLSMTGASSKTHQYAKLIARQDGSAIAWQQIDLDAPQTEASFTLAADGPIRGRLVDIEGQSAASVQLTIRSVHKTSTDAMYSEAGVGYSGDVAPAAWLNAVTADEEGRFTLNGIPAGHGVFLEVAGTEQFAPQSIMLNTGMPEQRGERDGTYRALVKNAAPGEEVVLPLAPAQLFEGVVTYEDTGESAAYARLTIWASQQEEFGSMFSVAGKADEHGKYRISPRPGVRFGVTAYAPDGTPYLASGTPTSSAIRWRAGDRVKRVDMKLPRGILVRGTVVVAGTGAPVAGASVQYIPEVSNNTYSAKHILTGWQAIQLSDEQGKFAMAVLPGPGRLLVHGPRDTYVLQTTTGQELSKGKPGGRRNYAHAIERIEPAAGADPLDLTIAIQPGATLSGRIVDEQGLAVDEALVVSRLRISPNSPFFRGFVPPTLGGAFELTGLDPKQEYNVFFLDPKRRLGATQLLRADSTDTTVVLKPCGQAVARFVDSQGQPLVEFSPALHMIVTPGVHEHDRAAARLGKVAADADFVANIDRTNYWPGPKTDQQGQITFPVLVPGATYRLDTYKDGKPLVLKEFSAQSGEQLELGEFTVDLDP